ncbi:MAG: hypothetical protein ACP5VS_02375 [Desulfomonilaceae bacterium]
MAGSGRQETLEFAKTLKTPYEETVIRNKDGKKEVYLRSGERIWRQALDASDHRADEA